MDYKNGKENIISFIRDAYLLAGVGSSQTSCELDTVLVENKTKTRVCMQLFSSMYKKMDELTKSDYDECYKENTGSIGWAAGVGRGQLGCGGGTWVSFRPFQTVFIIASPSLILP